jgi:hypothetical protein
MALIHGWVTRSTKPVTCSGCIATYQRRGPREIAPPGRWIAAQKAVIMSSRSCSVHSRENAPFSAVIPSR